MNINQIKKNKLKTLLQFSIPSIVAMLLQTVMSDNSKLKEHPEILLHEFEGGRYAVYHFKGIPQFLFMVYQEIFCRWLSRTGNELDERPIIDIYRKVEVSGYMEIDICFPLKTK